MMTSPIRPDGLALALGVDLLEFRKITLLMTR